MKKIIIDQKINHYVKNIIFTILMVLVSAWVWNSSASKSYASTAKYYSNFTVPDIKWNYLTNYLDKTSNKYVIEVTMNNTGKQKSGYKLYLKIKKDENINTNSIKININNTISNVENYRYGYTPYYNYYLINSDIIEKHKGYSIEVLLPNDMEKLEYDFEIEETKL